MYEIIIDRSAEEDLDDLPKNVLKKAAKLSIILPMILSHRNKKTPGLK
jgi:mRNA-degrading endonuclease RelE of RelBE toxin-antitoxin system